MADGGGIRGTTVAAIASAAAAVLHGVAAGIHAEHVGLSRIFAALAVAQLGAAIVGLLRDDRWACGGLALVNGAAFAGWLVTRLVGVSFVGGLEIAERPQVADTVAAVLAAVAVAAALACATGKASDLPGRALLSTGVLTIALLVPGLATATSHDHGGDHDAGTAHDDAHDDDHGHATVDDPTGADAAGSDEHDDESAVAADGDATAVEHGHDDATDTGAVHDDVADHGDDHGDDHDVAEVEDAAVWPRAWDPAGPIDFSGVPGVSAEQQARAEQLVADTLRELPAFAEVDTATSLGFRSIGDASTGFEHYINIGYLTDTLQLDPAAPESLVYQVDGDARTLVSAMFIVADTPIDSPELTDYGGPLMQWHVHQNLCWGLDDDGAPVVKSVLESPTDTCPDGTVNAGGENPMVHVWIAPHACGPFAALEGHGAGQADVSDGARMDLCDHDDHAGHGDDHDDETATVPYDPELPIDLGGVDGVTPQQQAFAENLVGATIRDLPQWSDPAVAEAAGFRSIGDAATGHEHYIQWDWIDDDVWLDPDAPESLVYQPMPDGSKRLVSAMFMMPSGTQLDDVPDWGGALMQWHIHGDLCFTDDPEAPQVGGLKPIGTSCVAPLVDGPMAPMIHVWIVPHECGPFAALEGIAGGQVPDGEQILCDHAHGSD